MRKDGFYGTPPKPRFRCHFISADGTAGRHSLRSGRTPDVAIAGSWYTATDIATALVDVARGVPYLEAARRAQVNYAFRLGRLPATLPLSGATVMGWLDRFAGPLEAAHQDGAAPDIIALGSVNMSSPNDAGRFTIVGAWGWPAGGTVGRMLALTCSPGAGIEDWTEFLTGLPVPRVALCPPSVPALAGAASCWPASVVHLSSAELSREAASMLAVDGLLQADGELRLAAARLADRGTWPDFRDGVDRAPLSLPETRRWIRYADRFLAGCHSPTDCGPHVSRAVVTKALHEVGLMLDNRVRSLRNEPRLAALLSLIRMRLNRMDVVDRWAGIVAAEAARQTLTTGRDDRRKRPSPAHDRRLNQPAGTESPLRPKRTQGE